MLTLTGQIIWDELHRIDIVRLPNLDKKNSLKQINQVLKAKKDFSAYPEKSVINVKRQRYSIGGGQPINYGLGSSLIEGNSLFYCPLIEFEKINRIIKDSDLISFSVVFYRREEKLPAQIAHSVYFEGIRLEERDKVRLSFNLLEVIDVNQSFYNQQIERMIEETTRPKINFIL